MVNNIISRTSTTISFINLLQTTQKRTSLIMKHFAKKFKTTHCRILLNRIQLGENPDGDDTLAAKEESSSQGSFAIFINNPGLHHVVEEIFWNLKSRALEHCEQINQSSSQILGKG